ncbi:YjgN family protein [Photobacterium atrarenae]|uniref:YjgN family protein n=1 Tax=Photobacterium atrarenae TaxID=865757 RepID=A0ABY5GE30_9GAMM|nr:YjgN family protein [Photobacterium atrarenae]UTV27374.1 YjgN family protein [Photobacterium atrarenae]
MENQVRFHGQGREFFGIWIVNILLSIVTLGIYSAWATVRTNKYFYGNTELAGDRFDYHATPKQILIGRIIAMICVLIWMVASQFFPPVAVGLMVFGIVLAPWLLRNNARFDARMTSYRNVRFDFAGTLKAAYGVFLGWPALCYLLIGGALFFSFSVVVNNPVVGGLLFLLTFVLAFVVYAWVASQIAAYYLNGYRYGNREFHADVELKAYIKTYLLGGLLWVGMMAVLLLITSLAFGINSLATFQDPAALDGGMSQWQVMIFVIYGLMALAAMIVNGFIRARIRNYLFGQVTVEGEPAYPLASRMTVAGLVGLILSNVLLLIVTLGLARPWVKVRTARYLAGVTYIIGDLALLQAEGEEMAQGAAIADEVANAFDLGVGIG